MSIQNDQHTADTITKLENEDQNRPIDEICQLQESEFTRNIEFFNKELSELKVVKRDVLDFNVTDEERAIIERRIKLQQKLNDCYYARDLFKKITRIKNELADLSVEEIKQGLEEYGNDEDMLIAKFRQDDGFLEHIRSSIASKRSSLSISDTQPYKAIEEKKNLVKTSKFKVDEGLAMLNQGGDPSKVFEGWSKARIMAFKQIEKKPNAYYYRFNAPGEKQGSGGWSNHEKQLFLSRLAELGPNGQWGIFSMGIPGRVGYQCANFYRHLIKTGEISDSNYKIDETGELRYLFGKKEGGEGFIRNFARTGQAAILREENKKSKRKRNFVAKDEDAAFTCPSITRLPHIEDINPLPNFIDAITLEEVKRPAISPYGHVLGYETWSRCLSQDPKNTCPLTKKPLSHRELVILTIDNIEKYRY